MHQTAKIAENAAIQKNGCLQRCQTENGVTVGIFQMVTVHVANRSGSLGREWGRGVQKVHHGCRGDCRAPF